MFNIYMKGFNQNGRIINEETLVQTIPAEHEGDLKLISPIVKGEMGNAEAFNFNIENGTKFYDAFRQMKTYIRVTYDGTTIFYGRVLTVDEGFHGTRKIRCEGPLSFLLDSAVEGIDEGNRKKVSTNEYLTSLLNNHNSILENDANRIFTIGEVPGNYSARVSVDQQIKNDSRKFGADGWTDTKGAIEDLRSHYGGYLRARLSGGIGSSIYLDWMDHYFNSSINSQTIEIGKNVIDLNTSMEIDNIFTAIVPIGNNHSSGSSSSSGTSGSSSTGAKHFYIPGKVLKVPDICAKYGDQLNSGYHRYEDYATAIAKYGLIIKTVSFDDAENKEQLYEKACEWIKNNYQGDVVRFTAKAIDLHQIGDSSVSKILVGDRVNIIYPSGSESGESTKKTISLTCMSIQYDLYNPENNQYTFGIPANIMTKSYGLHRQSQSNKTGSSGARSGGAMNTRSEEASWLEEVKNWLINHMVFYNGRKPYVEGDSGMYGPMSTTRDNYFLSTSMHLASGEWALYKFSAAPSATLDSSFKQSEYDNLMKVDPSGYGATMYKREHTIYNHYDQSENIHNGWRWERYYIPPTLTYDIIEDFNLIPYIKDEYGYDLKTGLSVRMPSQMTRSNGDVVYTGVDDEGNIVPKEIFKSDDPKYGRIYLGERGTLVSVQDIEGNWHYYKEDPETGEPIETSVRNIEIQTIDNKKEFGALVEGNYVKGIDPDTGLPTYFADTENMKHAYYFAQRIENFKGGELVVARMDGDIVRIGSEATMYIEDLSRFSQVHIAGLYHWEKDENDVPRVVIDAGGGMRTRRYTLDPETGKPIIDPSGQYVMHESGIFDNDNLSAGVITGKFDDERTKEPENRAYLYADHVLLGTRPDGTTSKKLTLVATSSTQAGLIHVVDGDPILDAGTKIYRTTGGVTAAYGIWDSSGQNLDGGMMVTKINNQTTAYLSGDHIVVGQRSEGGVAKDIKLVATDLSESGLIHVVDGDPILDAGTKIYRKKSGITAAYGIWDSSGQNLQGGLMIESINKNEVTTKIRGDRVDITTNDNFTQLSVSHEGLAVRVGTAETGITTLNATVSGVQTTVAQHTIDITKEWNEIQAMGGKIELIQGSALWTQRDNITGTVGQFEVITDAQGNKTIVVVSGGGMKIREDNVEYGVYTGKTLTGGIIVDKINGSNTQIVGTKVDIKASQIVQLGFFNDTTLTAGILIDKINGGTTKITSNIIALDGNTTINDVLTILPGGGVSLRGTLSFYDKGGDTSKYVRIASGVVTTNSVQFWSTDSTVMYKMDRDTVGTMVKTVSKSTDGGTLTLTRFDGTSVNFSKAAQVYLDKNNITWSGESSAGRAYTKFVYVTRNSSDDSVADSSYRCLVNDFNVNCIRIYRTVNEQTGDFSSQEHVIDCDPFVDYITMSHSKNSTDRSDISGATSAGFRDKVKDALDNRKYCIFTVKMQGAAKSKKFYFDFT